MARRKSTPPPEPNRWYRGAEVPMPVIRRFARQVAERFKPERIILFGSYAYGRPHADSDVDILVVMPCRNQIDQAYCVHMAVDPPFPVHVVVRTPYNMAWRLKEGESFLTEVVTKGRLLYEAAHAGKGPKGRSRLARGRRARQPPPGYDLVCFHCQQSAEKFLKALLEELAEPVPRTHDLDRLLRLLHSQHPGLWPLRRGLVFLTRYAVDTRYPGEDASKRQMLAAIRWAGRVREACRSILGL